MKEILEEFEGIENIQEMQRLLESCEDSPMDDDYDTDEGYLSSAYNKIRNGFMD
jgi:hypothetical protein